MQIKMAEALGINQSTISRELRRGAKQQITSQRKYYPVYLKDVGARQYQENHAYSNKKGMETNQPMTRIGVNLLITLHLWELTDIFLGKFMNFILQLL